MKIFIILSVLLISICSSCGNFNAERIRGNGNVKSEIRKANSFSAIEVRGAIDVYVSQDSNVSVKLETDENLLEYIDIHEDGKVLFIQPEKGYNPDPSGKIKVFVSAPQLKRFDASGSCNYIGSSKIISKEPVAIGISGSGSVNMELMTPEVKVTLSGAGSVRLIGQTKDFIVKGSGSSDIKCFGLLSENTRVNISGAGYAEVFASVNLDASISGAGTVKYKGKPAKQQKISGSGNLIFAED